MFKENFPIKGDLHIVIKDALTGEVKVDRLEKNLVVTVGKDWIASRMVGTASNVMDYMAVGTDSTSPAAGNTTLGTEVARVSTTVSGGTASTNTVTYVATFPAGTGTGALTEAGIFNANSSGTMLSRTTYSVINKGSGDEMTVTWVVTVG
jgi:hypothetical protein